MLQAAAYVRRMTTLGKKPETIHRRLTELAPALFITLATVTRWSTQAKTPTQEVA